MTRIWAGVRVAAQLVITGVVIWVSVRLLEGACRAWIYLVTQ
jgi:hypothetical protein